MKYITYTFTVAIACAIVLSASSFENVPFLDNLRRKLTEFNRSNPEEKVYLQVDKTLYKPGEDIWFNTYIVNSNTHQPTSTSDVVYVELIDPKGNTASRMRLLIHEGTSRGDFKIAASAVGGRYQLKAYTQWMLNLGDDNIFKKDLVVQSVITPRMLLKLDFEKEAYGPSDTVDAKITVANLRNEKVANASIHFTVSIGSAKIQVAATSTDGDGIAQISFQLPGDLETTDGLLNVLVSDAGVQESISRSIPIVLNKIDMKFFPEGGDLIDKVECRVAFKGLNEYGKGADVSGIIVDQNNVKVGEFESYHMGMGKFSLTPEPGKRYSAIIQHPSGNNPVQLPVAKSSGYTLRAELWQKDAVELNIHSASRTDGFLVGRVHEEIFYSEKVSLSEGHNKISIPTKTFPSGIAVFTLFDGNGVEQCERLAYVNPGKELSIKLTSDKKSYGPRERVNVTVETTDPDGKPVSASLALSVVDDQLLSFADDKQDNIKSWFMLSSELKGEVQEPAFYFDAKEPKAELARDLLLMTQGWRRFGWKAIDSTRTVAYVPEVEGTISGSIVTDKGEPIETEVILLETAGKFRLARVQTTRDGQFVFKGVDPAVPVLLMTRKPWLINVTNGIGMESDISATEQARPALADPDDVVPQEIENIEDAAKDKAAANLDMAMEPDVQQLNEVIVVGYADMDKKELAGSIVRVGFDALQAVHMTTLENLLQGRVSGLQIQAQTSNVAAQSNILLRGLSSRGAGWGEPLFIVDGQPVSVALNNNFSSSSMIGPDAIETITILQSPDATALYGSLASNGAILITTRNRSIVPVSNRNALRKPSRYTISKVMPHQFARVREFYTPDYSRSKVDEVRRDFRTTVYWNTIVTNEKGKANFSFYNNDATTSFRLSAEGITASGLIGRKEETYHTQLPFSLDVKFPEYMGVADTLKLPLLIKNTTDHVLKGDIEITLPAGLSVYPRRTTAEVAPQTSTTVYVSVVANSHAEKSYPIKIKLTGENYSDEFAKVLKVHPVGFPIHMSFSGKQLDSTYRFMMRDLEPGTLTAEFNAYPDVISDLFTGAQSILREPHGCFEQVSSSTFPNILALQFMQTTGQINPPVEKIAMNYIKDGYKQLVAYEIPGGGFDWFGRPPAHEGLSAYGLLEFNEMKKVYGAVSDPMMKRTRDWLLSRRDGKGGFTTIDGGLDDFRTSPYGTSNAYILYALAETGTTDITKEFNALLTEVWKSKDLYRMALAAIVAYDLGNTNEYNNLIKYFKDRMTMNGSVSSAPSVVWSEGTSLKNETLGFWTLALAKDQNNVGPIMNKCIQLILANRSYGGFGSTQGTTVALQALTEYARISRVPKSPGDIKLLVNGIDSENISYTTSIQKSLVLNKFSKDLTHEGQQSIQVLYGKTKDPLPYSLDLYWSSSTPASAPECKVRITTAIASNAIRQHETVRMNISLKNQSADRLPMTMAVVGIPAGLSVQPWQLKELQDKGVFDFYEITGEKVAFYYRTMAPSQERMIHLDLKAELPGTFTATASCAYLYYSSEWKDWTRGSTIRVE